MSALLGYQATVTSWGNGSGGISNGALLALMTYNEIELSPASNYLDTTRFRGALTGPAAGVAEGFNGVREWSGVLRGMNATPVPGHIGLVDVTSGYDTNCYSWSLNLRGMEQDVTAFQPSGDWKSYKPGIISWNGEYSAWLDDSEVMVAPNTYGSPVTPTFTLSSGNTLSGSAHITNIRMGIRVDDRQLVTFEYQGTSDLTSVGSANIIPADTSLAPFGTGSLVITYGTGQTATGDAFPTNVMVRCTVGQRTETEIAFRGTGALTFA